MHKCEFLRRHHNRHTIDDGHRLSQLKLRIHIFCLVSAENTGKGAEMIASFSSERFENYTN